MFENKAFYIEMIEKRDSTTPSQPADPDKFIRNFTQVAVVVVASAGAIIGMKTLSDVLISTLTSR